jgi:hypothetical protein
MQARLSNWALSSVTPFKEPFFKTFIRGHYQITCDSRYYNNIECLKIPDDLRAEVVVYVLIKTIYSDITDCPLYLVYTTSIFLASLSETYKNYYRC